jgi:hypothetical protein
MSDAAIESIGGAIVAIVFICALAEGSEGAISDIVRNWRTKVVIHKRVSVCPRCEEETEEEQQ